MTLLDFELIIKKGDFLYEDNGKNCYDNLYLILDKQDKCLVVKKYGQDREVKICKLYDEKNAYLSRHCWEYDYISVINIITAESIVKTFGYNWQDVLDERMRVKDEEGFCFDKMWTKQEFDRAVSIEVERVLNQHSPIDWKRIIVKYSLYFFAFLTCIGIVGVLFFLVNLITCILNFKGVVDAVGMLGYDCVITFVLCAITYCLHNNADVQS